MTYLALLVWHRYPPTAKAEVHPTGFMIALVPREGLKRERGEGGSLPMPRLSLQL
jgi:hypothetical protein